MRLPDCDSLDCFDSVVAGQQLRKEHGKDGHEADALRPSILSDGGLGIEARRVESSDSRCKEMNQGRCHNDT